jgi:hypothetical protein
MLSKAVIRSAECVLLQHRGVTSWLLWENSYSTEPSSEAKIRSCVPRNFPTFHRTRTFFTVFIGTRHRSISRARWIQSIPSHPLSRTSILILSFHLRLVLPSGLYTPRFHIRRPICIPLFFVCPNALPIPLDLIILSILYRMWWSGLDGYGSG